MYVWGGGGYVWLYECVSVCEATPSIDHMGMHHL